ncbi:TatD family deoxyribonuclease [Candidatus Bathyarchaeota archaeon]|nr:MAG: TatD family deoxyribonuclease [Candidatus Bathyarchaeota archaeon]
MIDIHCHLTFKQYDEDREKVIEDAKKFLKALITSGTEPEDSKKTLVLAEKYPKFVYVTLGLHPIHVPELTGKQIEEYMEFIKINKNKIVGIGEIGLDYYWIKDSVKIQKTKEVFVEFLSLAKELNLPVVLHFRQALEEGFKLVTQNNVKEAIFHCFSGKKGLAQEIVNQNYYISIAPNIFRSKNIKKVAKTIPLEKILTETDSPFLAVEGEKNFPQNVKFVVEKIAEERKISPIEVEKIVDKNASKIFRLPLT